MSFFGADGQADVKNLSDEVIYAQDNEQEGVQEEQPQAETEEIKSHEEADKVSPADEQTSDTGGEDEAPSVEAGQADIYAEENERLKHNYSELRSWASRVDWKNKQLERELAELKAKASPDSPDQPNTPPQEDIRDRVRQLVNDPSAFIQPLIEKQLQPMLQAQRERETLEAENHRREEFNSAYKECASAWPQLGDEANRRSMIQEMLKISRIKGGDGEAWKTDPARYIFDSCRRLWGLPRVNNPEAIEAARRAEREAVLAEINGRGNKTGLTINATPNKSGASGEAEPDVDPIIAEMRAAAKHGIF